MTKYFLGLDGGTNSLRAVLVDEQGNLVETSKAYYPHGGTAEESRGLIQQPGEHTHLAHLDSFPSETVLQDATDYHVVVEQTVTDVVTRAGVPIDDIMGLAVDFTACTVMPVQANGKPLSADPDFRNNPYAYVKKWKHQAATAERDLIDRIAHERSETWLANCGGKVNVQFLLPKVLETLRRAPDVYEAAYRFMEAGDWLTLGFTSQILAIQDERRSACFAGYKGNFANGFPSREFLRAVDPALETLVADKLNPVVYPMGHRAGSLTETWASRLGLNPGIAVSVPGIDAHVGAIGAGIEENRMVVVMGTSWCHMYTTPSFVEVDGLFGIVKDGILPGMYGYEGGQAAGGDVLAHFVRESVPNAYFRSAEEAGVDIHTYMSRLAAQYKPGETGLIALDWQAGNRSILGDSELSALMIGEKLTTTADQKYRAWMEALCFGTYKIIKQMESKGLTIKDIVTCATGSGNEVLVQMLADVTGKRVYVAKADETVAVGAGMLAAVASGHYGDIMEAQTAMGGLKGKSYGPDPTNHRIYQRLFAMYEGLHDHFGKGGDPVMKGLLTLQAEVR